MKYGGSKPYIDERYLPIRYNTIVNNPVTIKLFILKTLFTFLSDIKWFCGT